MTPTLAVALVFVAAVAAFGGYGAYKLVDRFFARRDARRLDEADTARVAAARVDDDCAASLNTVRQAARFQEWVDDHEYRPRAS